MASSRAVAMFIRASLARTAAIAFLCLPPAACDSRAPRNGAGEAPAPPAAASDAQAAADDEAPARSPTPGGASPQAPPAGANRPADGIATVPFEKSYVAPLADAYARIDPVRDGWDSEAFSEAASAVLADLARWLEDPDRDAAGAPRSTGGALCSPLRPGDPVVVFEDRGFVVRRSRPSAAAGNAGAAGAAGAALAAAVRDWFAGAGIGSGAGDEVHAKLKLYRVDPSSDGNVDTAVLATISSDGPRGRVQVNAGWACAWERGGGTDAATRLQSIRVETYEEVATGADANGPLLADATAAVLGGESAFRDQLTIGTDHWRARIPRSFGLDVVANHGLAIGDVNGDGLEDVYVCQQGGLPNRLFVQRQDGTLEDFTDSSGAGWLDYCASALIIDLDNDGDRDLVVSQDFRVLFMDNVDGRGRFELAFGSSTKAQTYSMTAADFDRDGLLDVYLCGYNPSAAGARTGAMGEPVPFHDANNGGPNILWRNRGDWTFDDVTKAVGLDANNRRFSFAAAWEDFDNDGDLDLYVANDYGRNNLYRRDSDPEGRPRFVDVAGELDVEDTSAGMSVAWGDYNRDGWMDLHVSNMFSGAGNRITYQRQFQAGQDPEVRRQFQRMARGNTLYASDGAAGFHDVSIESGITMGRWAWGSGFADLNNDGWEDILVANGFITAEDTGDL